MKIELSIQEDENRVLQSYGDTLASALTSENSAIASLLKVQKTCTNYGRLSFLGVAILAISFFFLIFWSDYISLAGEGFVVTTLTIGMLMAGFGFAIWSLYGQFVRCHDRLSDNNFLCAQLLALASQSPAVRSYIKSVTTTGRQLRICDLAKANVLHSNEQIHLADHFKVNACANLHSL